MLAFLTPNGVMAQDTTPTIDNISTSAESTPAAPILTSTGVPQPTITEPLPGQALQGKINIIGSTNAADFQMTEVEFAYANNPTVTWFLIEQLYEPVSDGLISQWDTSTISDGVYDLRITVHLEVGSQTITIIPGLRVRNYTPIETATPTLTSTLQPGNTPEPTMTPSPANTIVPPTNTPLPTNPARLSNSDISRSMGFGALLTLCGFLLIGVYIIIRNYVTKI